MTPSLVVLCLAAVALVAYTVSAALGVGLVIFKQPIERLAPAAQARLYFFAALLPVLVSSVVLMAALAPSFGWIADHCNLVEDPHVHPHICADHHVAGWPAIPVIAIACVIALRFGTTLARHLVALAQSRMTERALVASSTQGDTRDTAQLRILPINDHAQAFVIGLIRPRMFVTQNLFSGTERRHLPAVLAHERAHLRRNDPCRRFVAGIGLAFHLPGISQRIDSYLAQAQELAADDQAARAVGHRNVARALVALAKSHLRAPQSALAFAASRTETRVLQLMDQRARRDWPRLWILVSGFALAIAAASAGADVVHHGIEMLLGALGG